MLVPLYLHAVGPRIYGAWLASAEVLVWIQATDFGVPNLMIQRIASAFARNDRSLAAEWFAAGIVVLTLIGVAIGLVGVAISAALPTWVGVAPDESALLTKAFLVGIIAACAALIANGFVGLARAIQDTYFLSAALVVSAIAGLFTSLTLILAGWGLWAIPLGLVARAAIGLAAALIFAVHAWRVDFRVPFRIERGILTELLTTSPIIALGGLSYTLMSQCEIVLVAVLIRPEVAVVYALTRRAADLGRSLVDMIGFASYGGIAHLISSVDRLIARTSYARVLALHLSCAVAVAAAYLAVNHSLLLVWVGTSVAGGVGLIFLMSIQAVALGHSYLINLMYRATGRVLEGSLYLVIEALVRVPLMAVMLLMFGLAGVPVAAATTAIVSGILVRRRTFTQLGGGSTRVHSFRIWTARALMASIATALALLVVVPRWSYVVIVGVLISVGGGLALVSVDPRLRPLVSSAARRFAPVFASARS